MNLKQRDTRGRFVGVNTILRRYILKLRRDGEKILYISFVTGLTYSTVRNVCRDAGLATRHGGTNGRAKELADAQS